jgi:signal transduction histidine kinase
LISRDHDQIPIAHSISPIKGEDGMHGVVVVLRDMTNEREVDRLKTEFVSIASHQMHTPLMGTKWFLELMLRGKAGPMSPEQRNYLEQVYASNNRIISIVEDLLFASNVGAGDQYSVVKETVDLIPLIDETIKDNVDLIEKNKITIVKDESLPEHLTASVDIQMIKRIFYNLVSNACKYSKPLGTVEIGCDLSKEDEIIFFVKDNGFGIPQRQQSRIFERFFRADNVVTKVNEGTGLGLFIIKTLAQAHGGRIWFDSIENVGTTFYLSLPTGLADKKRKRAASFRSSTFKASSDETNV